MANATTVDVLDLKGKKAGTAELPADLFDVDVNVPLIHQVVVAQLAAARQGTHKTKTRGEVSGAGRKPFKQKGTGRARQGSIRAPQMRGGGMTHAVKPRDYDQRTPKKMIAAALPQKIAFFCCAGGKFLDANAITTALSPDKIMFVRIIEPKANQNDVFDIASISSSSVLF